MTTRSTSHKINSHDVNFPWGQLPMRSTSLKINSHDVNSHEVNTICIPVLRLLNCSACVTGGQYWVVLLRSMVQGYHSASVENTQRHLMLWREGKENEMSAVVRYQLQDLWLELPEVWLLSCVWPLDSHQQPSLVPRPSSCSVEVSGDETASNLVSFPDPPLAVWGWDCQQP